MIEQVSIYVSAVLFVAAIGFTWKVNQRVDNIADDAATTREKLAHLQGMLEGMTVGDDDN